MYKSKTFLREGAMHRKILISSLIFALTCTAFTENLFIPGGSPTSVEYVPSELIVRFDETGTGPGADAIRASVLTAAGGGTIERMFSLVPGLAVVTLPQDLSVDDAIVSFSATSGIRYAEPNYKYQITVIPNDFSFSELWGMHNTGQTGGTFDADIDAPEAWELHTGSNQVIVGVIDTGVDYQHEDLADNMWVNEAELNGDPGIDDDGNGFVDDIYGYDFMNGDGDPMDDHGHGTHVSGTIGAVGDNSIGVAGVCWDVRIMALKGLDEYGWGSTAALIGCIEYSTLMGAHLTNNSWGGGGFSLGLYDAINAAKDAGILFVAAAGNNNFDNDVFPFYPASYDLDNIISVMSTDHNDERSGFSNWGFISVDLAAPGSNILSSLPNNSYGVGSGTSMAAPHVAGACALVMAADSDLIFSEVINILLENVDVLQSLDGLCVTGGRLNIFESMEEAVLDFIPKLIFVCCEYSLLRG